jgi:hypothetical protein
VLRIKGNIYIYIYIYIVEQLCKCAFVGVCMNEKCTLMHGMIYINPMVSGVQFLLLALLYLMHFALCSDVL